MTKVNYDQSEFHNPFPILNRLRMLGARVLRIGSTLGTATVAAYSIFQLFATNEWQWALSGAVAASLTWWAAHCAIEHHHH